ncbi:hypothetical protein AMK59_4011, partial [Oryctes borbonicus]
VDRLVEKWAPLVWLAPEEKYFPLAAEEFLQHVHPVDVNGRIISSEDTLPIGRSSETLYLIPKNDLASLKGNTTSFLNGRNPLNEVVPVYVTVSECSRPPSIVNPCSRSYKSNVFGNCNEKNDPKKLIARRIHFHLTYWMFYPYNEGKEVCFLGKIPTPLIFNRCLGKKRTFGNHIGDFEHVSITFDEDYVPSELFLAIHDIGAYYTYDSISKIFKYSRELVRKGIIQRAEFPPVVRTFKGRPVLFAAKGSHVPSELFLAIHDIGAYYTYDSISKIFKYSRELVRKGIIQRAEFPPVVRTFKGRPVLFAAKGSHGLWSAPGQFPYLRVPKLYDLNGYGTPWKTWKSFHVYRIGYDPPPVWMKYLGRWGNPKFKCFLFNRLGICEFSEGPYGISR